jgi:CCR4-NOT transcriptional regulation complex NOT5 subunit
MRKAERVSRAAKRTGSQKVREKVRHKARQGSQIKAKASRRNAKITRRATVFKSTNWYQTAAQSIGISPRAAPP